MGWDNTTEMLAAIVDSVNVLIRLTYNINAKSPLMDPIPRVSRPYENEEQSKPEAVGLAEFNAFLRKGDSR